jgi:hypothetical protein
MSSGPSSPRTALLLALLLASLLAAGLSWSRLGGERRAAAACDLAGQGRFEEAVQSSEGLPLAEVAECRCAALAELGRLEQCLAELEAALVGPEPADFLPPLPLTRLLLARLRDGGRAEAAAPLARRAGASWPDDGMLRYLEFTVRAQVDGEDAAARALAAELESGGGHGDLRLLLAAVFERRGDLAAAARALGVAPPEGQQEAWYRRSLEVAAGRGDVPWMKALCRRWRAEGGAPSLVAAAYVVSLGNYQLSDPERPMPDLYAEALADEDVLPAELAEFVTWRYAAELALLGRSEEALAVYRRGKERYPMEAIGEDELLAGGGGAVGASSAAVGTLRLQVDAARVRVSPPPSASVDSPFEELPVVDGSVVVQRRPDAHPVRWVALDPGGGVVGSGSARVSAGQDASVEVQARPPSAASAPWTRSLRPADGKTRIALVIWDCADWRLVRYLQARGELPVLRSLMETGTRAVVRSTPAYTAAAMEALVHPEGPGSSGVLPALHEIGAEIRERRSVPLNPLEPLAWFVPQRDDTAEHFARGDRRVVSLLFSHGVLDASRQGEVLGPRGARAEKLQLAAFRPLDEREQRLLPNLKTSILENAADFAQEAAALMDASQGAPRARGGGRPAAADRRAGCDDPRGVPRGGLRAAGRRRLGPAGPVPLPRPQDRRSGRGARRGRRPDRGLRSRDQHPPQARRARALRGRRARDSGRSTGRRAPLARPPPPPGRPAGGVDDLAPHRTVRSPRGARSMRSLCLLLLVALWGCSEDPALPEGLVAAGDAAPLRELLQEVATMERTPAAAAAGRAVQALKGCTGFEARLGVDEDPGLAFDRIACADRSGPPTLTWRGDWGALRAVLGGSGDPRATIDWWPAERGGVRGAFLPADGSPGAPVLAGEGALLHGRWRADAGLDLSGLVAQGSEADRLLGLRADLLSSAVLDGSWEVAIWPVPAGWSLPPLAVAADHRLRAAAEEGLEQLVVRLEEQWSAERVLMGTPFGDATCLPSIQVMPGFAPCGIVTDRAVVLAWNPATLRLALQEERAPAPEHSSARIDLAALPGSDARIAEARQAAAGGAIRPAAEPVRWPWGEARLEGRKQGDGYRFELALDRAEEGGGEAGGASP